MLMFCCRLTVDVPPPPARMMEGKKEKVHEHFPPLVISARLPPPPPALSEARPRIIYCLNDTEICFTPSAIIVQWTKASPEILTERRSASCSPSYVRGFHREKALSGKRAGVTISPDWLHAFIERDWQCGGNHGQLVKYFPSDLKTTDDSRSERADEDSVIL